MDYTRRILLAILVYLSVLEATIANSEWSKEFTKEANQMFRLNVHSYNPIFRPSQQIVVVTANVTVAHIHDFDVTSGTLQTVLDVDLAWYDSRLTWHATYLHAISIDLDVIWAPDVVVANSIRPTQSLFPDKVRIRKEGSEDHPNLLWKRRELVTTPCVPDSPTTRCNISLAFLSRLAAGDGAGDRGFDAGSTVVMADNFISRQWDVGVAKQVEVNATDAPTDTMDLFVSLTEREIYTTDVSTWPHLSTSGSHRTGRLQDNNAGACIHSNGHLQILVAMVIMCCCQGALHGLLR